MAVLTKELIDVSVAEVNSGGFHETQTCIE